MKRFNCVALATGLAIIGGQAADSQAAKAQAPLMKVLIAPSAMDEATNKGEVRIVISAPGVDAPAGAALFTPFVSENLSVTDSQGEVPRAPEPPMPEKPEPSGGPPGAERRASWIPARAVRGDLTISYVLPVSNTPDNGGTTPIRPRIDGKGFSAIGMSMLSAPDLKQPYRILIDWDLSAMGPAATAVSSFGDGDVEAAAGSVSRLGRVVFMAGELKRDPPPPSKERFSAVWSGDPGFDPRPTMNWTAKLHSWMVDFFQTPDDPAYRVFLRYNGGRNPGGGVAFPNSFFATYGPGVTGDSMKNILGHEMVHTFTAPGLGKWYDEGNAVYYQVRLPWRAGMVRTEQYLDDINLTAARYYTNAEIGSAEERIAPNFFSNMWLNTLAYDRGALYFAALDGKMRRASGGKRSIDELIRILVHRDRAGEELKEQDWIDLLQQNIGDDAVALHRSMMTGGIVVPESDDYGPCFRRTIAKTRRYELGFTSKTLPDRRVEVTQLVEGSEAAKAGLRNGDIVVLPVITTEGVRRHHQRTITAKVARGAQTFEVTYLPRGEAMDTYQWERVAGVPDSACRP